MELVTGATGYVGGRLLRRLVAEGRAVRALARVPARVAALPGVEAVAGDLVSGAGLERALEGVETAYYLVHSMEAPTGAGDRGRRGTGSSEAPPHAGDLAERAAESSGLPTGAGDFSDRDRRAASAFASAAAAAGVKRIVYLGGIVPAPPASSPHLRSRLEVERLLLEAVPGSTALRASIVIGAGSSSFRILVRLVERLRVLPLPGWRAHRTQPIDERDAIEFLARTPQVTEAAGRSLDIVGPDVLSYAEMLERIAESMGVGRLPLGFGRSLTPAASALVSAVTAQPLELVRPLMESLEFDLLPRDADEAARLYRLHPRPFERAVEHALAQWESHEPLSAR